MRRNALLLVIGSVAIVLIAFLWWPRDGAQPIDGPAATGPAAEDEDPAGAEPVELLLGPNLEVEAARPARTRVTAGSGWLELRPTFGTLAENRLLDQPGWLALRVVPIEASSGRAAVPLEWVGDGFVGAELAAGSWRVVCDHGPGDPPGVGPSPGWTVDPPEDIQQVPSGSTVRSIVRLVRTIDPPEPGKATIVGMALIDGRPAVDHVVMLGPFARASVGQVAEDGSFRIDDAPSGWHELELWSRSSSRSGVMRYATRAIAPRDGEIVRIEVHGRSARLSGRVVDVDGRPVERAQVELWFDGIPVLGSGIESAKRFDWTDADGRFDVEPVPTGRVRVDASSGEGVVPATHLDLRAGPNEATLIEHPFVRATATVELEAEEWDSVPQQVHLLLHGPIERRLTAWNGVLEHPRLIAGEYRVFGMVRGARLVAEAPLTVPEGGLEGGHIVLRRRR